MQQTPLIKGMTRVLNNTDSIKINSDHVTAYLDNWKQLDGYSHQDFVIKSDYNSTSS